MKNSCNFVCRWLYQLKIKLIKHFNIRLISDLGLINEQAKQKIINVILWQTSNLVFRIAKKNKTVEYNHCWSLNTRLSKFTTLNVGNLEKRNKRKDDKRTSITLTQGKWLYNYLALHEITYIFFRLFQAGTSGVRVRGVRRTCSENFCLCSNLYIGIIYSLDMCSICILSVNPYCLPFQSVISQPTLMQPFIPLVLHKYANKMDKDRFCGVTPDFY